MYIARTQLRCHFEQLCFVFTLYIGRQPVVCVVSYCNGFLYSVIGNYAEHWAKNLFAGNLHIVTHLAENGGANVKALAKVFGAFCASNKQSGTFILAKLNIVLYAFVLALVGDRA